MSDNTDDQDLRDVIAEEKSRGSRRRKVDTTEQGQRRRIEKAALDALRSGDLHAYVRALHDAGRKDGTPEYAKALQIFYSLHGRR